MARAKNRSTSQQISDLETAIKELQAKQEIESLNQFLSPEDAEKLNFLLHVKTKLEKLEIDFGVKMNQSPVVKEIDSIRKVAQREKDAVELENELDAEA